jgi:hypothetical protein
MIPDPYERTIRLPVKLDGTTWKLIDGRPLPAIEKESIGEIVLPAYALVEEEARNEWMSERTVIFLRSGTTLWAKIKPDNVPEKLKSAVRRCISASTGLVHGVAFILVDDLQLTLRAGKKSQLVDCECEIPSLNRTATSINEAYTLISAAYEPNRRSHAGNVFQQVFFGDVGKLRPLNEKRSVAERAAETDNPKPLSTPVVSRKPADRNLFSD